MGEGAPRFAEDDDYDGFGPDFDDDDDEGDEDIDEEDAEAEARDFYEEHAALPAHRGTVS